ncbi:hypothetical protein OSSY52_16080 [Tepiditoga spiralis]|uniref:LysR substrate-binding domain-containing protein n=1 Tax=Tepiditoga spiralis TaxID=2108365 RepID=A0A7G1G914_9BACT|nr:hypothetical protein [Tepiditoga spiralis]BBE31467.1 hypothetical protein OSSY52_16080 [Tepiditoga spiralis]
MKLVYCPTMTPFASEILKNVSDEVEFIKVPSAAQALSMLKYNEADSVLIGRSAKQRELSEDTKELRLKNGYTLAFKDKEMIYEEELKDLSVLTYLNENDLNDFKDTFKEIKYLSSLKECLKFKLDIPILVDWQDFREDFQLLIPVNDDGKVMKFRAPVLYYKKRTEDILKIKNMFNGENE